MAKATQASTKLSTLTAVRQWFARRQASRVATQSLGSCCDCQDSVYALLGKLTCAVNTTMPSAYSRPAVARHTHQALRHWRHAGNRLSNTQAGAPKKNTKNAVWRTC